MSRACLSSRPALALLIGLSLLARSAAAEPAVPPVPAPVGPASAPADVEGLLGFGQFLGGGATALASLFVMGFAGAVAGNAALFVALVAPAGVGGAVCSVGSKSPRYDQGCGVPILGAYLGALSIIPGFLLGAHLGDSGEMDMSGAFAGIAGAMLAWIVVQPLVSTVFWHIWKEPRSPVASAPALLPAPAPPGLRAELPRPRLQRLAGQLTVPLYQTSF
jgi:hypothetical protein